MDRGPWQAPVHGVTMSRTGLSNEHSVYFDSICFKSVNNVATKIFQGVKNHVFPPWRLPNRN